MIGRTQAVVLAGVCAVALVVVLSSTAFGGLAFASTSGQSRTVPPQRPSQVGLRRSLERWVVGYPHAAPAHRIGAGRRSRIVGGYGGVQSDWPFMAFVLHGDAAGNPDFACSGTVVAANVVLTAGHCAVDETTGATLDPSGFGVLSGSVDLSNQSARQLSFVSKVIVNPGYIPGIFDSTDAALLVLATPTTAPTIALASNPDANLVLPGTGAFIAGWGTTYQGGPPVTNLQWASTVVQTPGYCSQVDPGFDATSELCAVNPPDLLTGACNGDSGGPLATPNSSGALVEIGVITYGPADCDTDTADYFTNVIAIQPWVASWSRAVAPSPSPTPSPSPSPAPAPPPPAPSPPRLPTLTLGQAKNEVRMTVAGALGQRAHPAHRYRAHCSRRSSTRVACAIQFWHGPNVYYGTVTVSLVSGPNRVTEWTDTYTLHWVSDRCYFHSGHPRRCAIQTRRGTW
jgi:hypothetical protein